MPNLSSYFWILSALSAQSYLIMYILMFISAIRLRYTQPHVPRAYRVPFHYPGMWFFAGIGILVSVFAICLGFVPPVQIEVGSLFFYDSFLAVGLLIMIGIPLIIYQCRKPSWAIKLNVKNTEK
jgi:amino acid transporter